ncbi:transcription elongation factor GreA [Paenibacillus sp. J31TS4]|uniref:transcription elongation factor GreA n=1 Tax=Paenibacillus sp. J31TS4 TaxID=2807195 RepID=UPI001B2B8FC0|nr:transcription elongation factor GreA [Paenibacillus sp. J31TS4]GIP40525.1 transcription elongation factor GreA [Paenibacillus sp. J31TS4]
MTNENAVILTREGYAKLEAELEELKTVKRKELASRIKTAISYGDLKENSEYHSAKDEQGFMEGRIATLEKMLRTARIADTADASTVQVGATVVLNDLEVAEKIQYKIVGPAEADVMEDKISYESPLGKALLGKAVGDTVEVDAPMGVIKYELLDIKIG